MMAAKQCPGCRKQVPVACKKCGCGHSFFAARRPSKGAKKDESQKKDKSSITKQSSSAVPKPTTASPVLNVDEVEDISLSTLRPLKQEEPNLPRRRTGRVQREKPNFYDALEYDNQTRRKQRVVRSKPKSDDCVTPSLVDSPQKEVKSESVSPVVKKRRGRPPRLTAKPVKSSKPTVSLPLNNKVKQPRDLLNTFTASDYYHEDLMKGISPEKALQCTTILEDINRKWATISWRI